MKRFSVLMMVCLLSASLLAGCRSTQPGTTGATQNNPSTSSTTTVRPEPTVTKPSSTQGTTGTQGRMNPRG